MTDSIDVNEGKTGGTETITARVASADVNT